MSQGRIYLCLPLPALKQSVLVTEMAVSERASGRLRRLGISGPPMKGRYRLDFREVGGCDPLPQRHRCVSFPDYFHELSKVETLVGRQVGPPEHRVWVCQKPGGHFCQLSMRGKCQSCSWESIGNDYVPKAVSDTPSVSLYSCLFTMD